jgi:RND family efflux transporter MFP subunit
MLDTLAQSWLSLQCQMIPNVDKGLVALGLIADGGFEPTAFWPEGDTAPPGLMDTARLAMSRNASVISDHPLVDTVSKASSLVVAYPLFRDGRPFGVVAVQIQGVPEQQQAVLQLLKWGSAWLELLMHQETPHRVDRLNIAFDTLAATLRHERFQESATAAATELARRLSCERVSLGFRRNRSVSVQALSHSAHFEPRANLVRNIESAMQEALVRETTAAYPPSPPERPETMPAHARLAREEGEEAICTLPLISNEQRIGVLMLERSGARSFDAATIKLCEAVAALIGPTLEMKRRQDRSPMVKLKENFAAGAKRIIGPGALGMKLGLALLIGLGGFLSFTTGEYRIAAPATLEGTVQRAVVAPYEGYLAAAHARAGEPVSAGQVLAELDDKDLKLEHRKWRSQREELNKQYRKALANLDHSQVRILRAQMAQAEAEVKLLEERLARTRLLAPIDGAIISGDLSRSLGMPVERGQVLFEIAPLDGYRVVLEVDEWDIADISLGQQGQLTLSALPAEHLPLTVESISTVSQAEEGHAVFRVEASLQGRSDYLRPGMQGVAKVLVERRNLLRIWTRRLTAQTQLWIWTWLP